MEGEKVTAGAGLAHVLERIFDCGLPGNRPGGSGAGMCEPLFRDQRLKNPVLKIGLTPSPIFGDIRAPIVFVGINPQHNPIDLSYDELPRADRAQSLRRFREYALGKHSRLAESEYRSNTSRRRNGYLEKVSRELNALHGTRLNLTIRRGAAFTTNVVQCPTETIWRNLDISKETKGDIARRCSDNFLWGIFGELRNPKIVFLVGNEAFEWLKRRKEFDLKMVRGDARCDIDWAGGSGSNAGKYCVVDFGVERFYAIINPLPYIIQDEGLTVELIRDRFLLPADFAHVV